jgi:thiosulfate/3-mercaptopyruvate sulfurtransferase
MVGALAALAATRQGLAAARQATPTAQPESILVDAAWLAARLGANDLDVVAFAPASEFTAAHIPGSVQIDWPDLEVADTSETSLADWRQAVAGLVGALGVSPDRTVVAYDHGTLFAARLWWVLRYLGHERIHVLDGGLPAWTVSGGESESGDPPAAESNATPYPAVPVDDLLATKAECLSLVGDPDTVFLDTRSAQEYADGHIPGAINIPYTLNARDDSPPFWLPTGDLVAMYAAAGVTPEHRVIPYCSSGVRSAVTAMTLTMIGYPDVSLYTGSWNEWSADPDTPKETGGG